jgi:ankyrin repeat protein
MVKFLVDNNADINAQDNEGWTPLHAAVSVGNLDVAKYLISKGASLSMCNNDNDLPIDLCDSSNAQMKDYLDEEMRRQSINAEFEKHREEELMYNDAKSMDFNNKIHYKSGATPLHVSAAKGYIRVME